MKKFTQLLLIKVILFEIHLQASCVRNLKALY